MYLRWEGGSRWGTIQGGGEKTFVEHLDSAFKNPAYTDEMEYMDEDSGVEAIVSEDENIMDLD
jgi:hypothetical protein